MKIKRERFLNDLMMVKAGLSARESLEQSSSFAFKGKEVMTFNDEVACRKGIDIKIDGAIDAQCLLDILEKMPDPYLKVTEDNGELKFSGKRKGFIVVKDAQVSLPIDRVEVPKEWFDLPDMFGEAVDFVKKCVSSDETKFFLTCIHLTSEYVEACDNAQIMRRRIELPMLKKSILVRGDAISQITNLKMTEIAITESWIHFRNEAGLTYSARKYVEDYPELGGLLKVVGKDIVIPKGLAEASDRAAVFGDESSDPIIMVVLAPGMIRIKGRSGKGRYWEVKSITYKGPEMEFLIRPSLLRYISEHHSDAIISHTKLKINGGSAKQGSAWEYVTVLGVEKEEEKKPKKSKAEADQEE